MGFLRFFLYNLFGNGLPILAALVAVPVIAHHAGGERVGALGVVWSLIGYFGFLDFGLSRVVTRRVALAHEEGHLADELAELRGFLWWWALPALVFLGGLLIALLPLCGAWLPAGWLGQEVAAGWLWIALCIPATLMMNWLRGALEGMQRFARLNVLKSVFGIWNYAGPALVVLWHPTLDAMIAAILGGRVLALLAHAWACIEAEPGILLGHAPRRVASLGRFFREGGWMTVSNLIGPLMLYSDRFVLAALVAPISVYYYVTSQEVMLRTLMIPAALSGVLFPRFSGGAGMADSDEMQGLYRRSQRFIAALMLPMCAVGAALSYDALRLWLGEDFAAHSHHVVEIIAIGIFVTSIGQLPLAWLQGTGRSYLTARLHMVQLPLYAAGLYAGVEIGGILGAAWAWSLRVIVDTVAMLLLATGDRGRTGLLSAGKGAVLVGLVGCLTGPAYDWHVRAGVAAGAVVLAAMLAWYGLLDASDRSEIGKMRHAY